MRTRTNFESAKVLVFFCLTAWNNQSFAQPADTSRLASYNCTWTAAWDLLEQRSAEKIGNQQYFFDISHNKLVWRQKLPHKQSISECVNYTKTEKMIYCASDAASETRLNNKSEYRFYFADNVLSVKSDTDLTTKDDGRRIKLSRVVEYKCYSTTSGG